MALKTSPTKADWINKTFDITVITLGDGRTCVKVRRKGFNIKADEERLRDLKAEIYEVRPDHERLVYRLYFTEKDQERLKKYHKLMEEIARIERRLKGSESAEFWGYTTEEVRKKFFKRERVKVFTSAQQEANKWLEERYKEFLSTFVKEESVGYYRL